MSPALETKPRTTGRAPVAAVSIIALYVALSLASAVTSRPQVDESLHANPGYNLLHKGVMAADLYEFRGYLPLSSERRTYYYPPLFFIASAGWYWLVGLGVIKLRLLSVLCGLLAVISWYAIAKALFQSAAVAWTVAALVSVDYYFVIGASQARMDMMCAALGIAAIAVYLSLRRERFHQAVFWSYALATASVLTHQAGLGYWAGLVFVTLYFDRRAVSPKIVALAAIPCLVGGVSYGIYIAQDPQAFLDQMRGTMAIAEGAFRTGEWSRIHWIASLEKELVFRYAGPYGLMPGVGLMNRLKAFVLLSYVVSVAGLLVMSRRRPELRVIPVLAIINFLYLGLLSASKFSYYLPHTTMIMAACLAVFACQFQGTSQDTLRKRVAYLSIAAVAAIQLAGLLYRVHDDPYRKSFVPAAKAIEALSPPGTLVIGSGELWFYLAPRRPVLHDPSLGYRRGVRPTIFVMDPLYRQLHETDRLAGSPIYPYVQNYLDTSRLAYNDGYYQVYVSGVSDRARKTSW